MAYEITCGTNTQNTGVGSLCADIGAITGFIIAPWDYLISTESASKLLATWEAAIQAEKSNRVYPFPLIFSHEDQSEDPVYEEGSLGSIFVRDGKMTWRFAIESSRYKHKAFKSFSNQKKSVFFIDAQGRIHGVTNTSNNFLAINMSRITVEKLKVNDGTAGTKTFISMQFDDVNQFEMYPAVITPSFSAKSLEGLKDAALAEVGTSTTSLITVSVKISQSGENVLGLSEVVGEDFEVLNASGIAQTPTTITDNSDGTYSFAFGTPLAGSQDYTVNLKASNEMVTLGYESTGAVTIAL